MQIRKVNPVSQDEAVAIIKGKMEALLKESFPGVKIENPELEWNKNHLIFSFRAKKGWIKVTIRGTVNVTESEIIMDSKIPGAVKRLVGEEKIKSVISTEFDKMFN